MTPLRLLGLATLGYSALITARPAAFAKPCGLLDEHGKVPPGLQATIRSIGIRDGAMAVGLVLARQTPVARALTLARVAGDLGDAVALGRSLPDPRARAKAVVMAGGWGVLTAVVGLRRS